MPREHRVWAMVEHERPAAIWRFTLAHGLRNNIDTG